jgi:hypothetical protein
MISMGWALSAHSQKCRGGHVSSEDFMQEGAASWLNYHSNRERRHLGSRVVHFDGTSGNQDPYIWADRFL